MPNLICRFLSMEIWCHTNQTFVLFSGQLFFFPSRKLGGVEFAFIFPTRKSGCKHVFHFFVYMLFFKDKNPSLPGKVASAAKHCRFELRRAPTIHCEACNLGAVGYWCGMLLTFMGCLCFVHVFQLVRPEFVARSEAIKMAEKKPGDGKDGQEPWERMVDAWNINYCNLFDQFSSLSS